LLSPASKAAPSLKATVAGGEAAAAPLTSSIRPQPSPRLPRATLGEPRRSPVARTFFRASSASRGKRCSAHRWMIIQRMHASRPQGPRADVAASYSLHSKTPLPRCAAAPGPNLAEPSEPRPTSFFPFFLLLTSQKLPAQVLIH
jgi:hypothetical protein